MPPNETSALLKNYREHHTTDSGRNGYTDIDARDNHIVYVNKDPAEYEPIFSINDYSAALTLDELMPYVLDPWWQNLRRILFLTFWLTLIMTFITACLLSYLEAGHTTCNIIEKHLSTSTTSGILSTTTTTTLPTTIAKIISTDLLSSKLPMVIGS